MKATFDGGKIVVTITKRDVKVIVENENRWDGLKILDIEKLCKLLAKKITQPFLEDGDGDFSPIEKSVEDTAYELYTSGADCVEAFDEHKDDSQSST